MSIQQRCMEVEHKMDANCKEQIRITGELFSLFLPKFNGLKQVAYEAVEDMMANALAPSFVPTTTEERLAKQLANLYRSGLQIFTEFLPEDKALKHTHTARLQQIAMQYNDFCNSLVQ